jgi:hypothetical protein
MDYSLFVDMSLVQTLIPGNVGIGEGTDINFLKDVFIQVLKFFRVKLAVKNRSAFMYRKTVGMMGRNKKTVPRNQQNFLAAVMVGTGALFNKKKLIEIMHVRLFKDRITHMLYGNI